MPRTPVVMPKMSMTMTEGEVVEILVTVGQKIATGDVVAVVGTDKTDMEVESDHEGEVVEITSAPGQVLEVGAPLFVLETEGEDLLAGMFGSTEPAPAEAAAPAAPVASPPATGAATNLPPAAAEQPANEAVLAMPGARKLAKERGIDIASVRAASPSGIVKQSDIPLSGSRAEKARAQIAQVVSSAMEIPQFSLTRTVKLKAELAKDPGKRFVQLARAWVRTINSHPKLAQQFQNGNFTDAAIRVAALVRSPLGFVSAAIDAVGIEEPNWADSAREMISAAAENRVALKHLGNATTSITDLSEFGITAANTLLLPPQSSAINIGSVRVKSNKVLVDVTLVLDHRIADPGDAALALETFEKLLNEVAFGNS